MIGSVGFMSMTRAIRLPKIPLDTPIVCAVRGSDARTLRREGWDADGHYGSQSAEEALRASGGRFRTLSAAMDRRVDLYRTLVALVTRLDPSRANRPVLPDAVALTH
jgi:hypothetical protein